MLRPLQNVEARQPYSLFPTPTPSQPIACNSHSATIPAAIGSSVRRVVHATIAARIPAINRTLPGDRSSVPPGVSSSGNDRAQRGGRDEAQRPRQQAASRVRASALTDSRTL